MIASLGRQGGRRYSQFGDAGSGSGPLDQGAADGAPPAAGAAGSVRYAIMSLLGMFD